MEITYYFNAKGADVWTDPANMIDNILTNYGTTASTGDTQLLNGNTCPGTNLGTISKVEIRVYGYGDADDFLQLTPVFGGSDDGGLHSAAPGINPVWSGYYDITNDTNHPDWSSWSHVQNLDVKVIFIKSGKANTMHCAKVEIRVTYTPLPEAPTNLSSPSQTENSIDLSLTKGANSDKTLIRFKDDQYPTGVDDGELAYFDTGESVTVNKGGSEKSEIADTTGSIIGMYTGGAIRAGGRYDNFPISIITKVSFYLYKKGLPTGTAYLRVRKVSDDSILGTIASIDVSNLTTVPTWYDYDCEIVNASIQDLRFLIEYDGGDGDNCPRTQVATSDINANLVRTYYTDSWHNISAHDPTLKIYYYDKLQSGTTYYFRAWGYQSSTELYSVETADLTQATSGAPPAYIPRHSGTVGVLII